MISPPITFSAEIDTWVFDLDNTLYPFDSDLFVKSELLHTFDAEIRAECVSIKSLICPKQWRF